MKEAVDCMLRLPPFEYLTPYTFQVAKPLDNTDMSIAYRKHMVRTYVACALREVC